MRHPLDRVIPHTVTRTRPGRRTREREQLTQVDVVLERLRFWSGLLFAAKTRDYVRHPLDASEPPLIEMVYRQVLRYELAARELLAKALEQEKTLLPALDAITAQRAHRLYTTADLAAVLALKRQADRIYGAVGRFSGTGDLLIAAAVRAMPWPTGVDLPIPPSAEPQP